MYEFIQTEEQPKKSLKLKRLKMIIPKTDFLGLLIIILSLTNLVAIIVLRRVDSGITGLLIGLVVYFLLARENTVIDKLKQTADKISSGVIEVE